MLWEKAEGKRAVWRSEPEVWRALLDKLDPDRIIDLIKLDVQEIWGQHSLLVYSHLSWRTTWRVSAWLLVSYHGKIDSVTCLDYCTMCVIYIHKKVFSIHNTLYYCSTSIKRLILVQMVLLSKGIFWTKELKRQDL